MRKDLKKTNLESLYYLLKLIFVKFYKIKR